MFFNSTQYILAFLPATVIVAIAARNLFGPRAAQACVLAASLIFYAHGRVANLIYLALSIVFNWLFADAIAKAAEPRRKNLLRAAIIVNVGYLCLFKYTNFMLGFLPGLRERYQLHLAFVLGISFFTVSQIMYVVDCYEDLLPASSLFDHTTFVSFFPYIISGPIARAKRMIHQFPNFGGDTVAGSQVRARGLYIFMIGLFKKVILADSLALGVNSGFSTGLHRSAMEAWVLALGYTLQLYFDFSGYTDMAMGSAFMLGIELPRNFDAPLRSLSIIEFWQRWHISLTNFITTYLYTPILRSFSVANLFSASVATFLAMTIAGLWHGAAFTFVIFGAWHGCGLVINQYWRKKKMPKLPKPLSWIITLLWVSISMVFFRSPSVPYAMAMVRELGDLHNLIGTRVFHEALLGMKPNSNLYMLPIAIAIACAFFGPSSDRMASEFRAGYRSAAAVAAMLIASLFFMNINAAQSFIYFKF